MYRPIINDSDARTSFSAENGCAVDDMPADEEHLLPKSERDPHHTDDEWLDEDKEGNDNEDSDVSPLLWNSVVPYAVAGLSIGFLFIALKVFIVKFGHGGGSTHEHHRGYERLYDNGTASFGPTVILLSLDGFRPEYLTRNVTPHLSSLASKGVRAEYMDPCFPSSTFPNHWTFATGLYPETHGIVANTFYDPEQDETFHHSNRTIADQRQWWSGEPIWITAAKQGLFSASMMWPGSTAILSNYVVPYNASVTSHEKMDTALSWLDMPTMTRPQLITLYIPDIDTLGHQKGPEGKHMNDLIRSTDDAIGHLIDGLVLRNLDSHVHLVVVSDHGMTKTEKSKVIFYDDILSEESMSFLRTREALPLLDLRPKVDAPAGAVQQIYRELHNYTMTVPDAHFQVYLREEVPERFHYSASDRITPIVAIPDLGYSFVTRATFDTTKEFSPAGNHGYDNLSPDMRAIFLATGPKITKDARPGSVLAPFSSIEVYNFLTELLNINAAPNNGTLHGHLTHPHHA